MSCNNNPYVKIGQIAGNQPMNDPATICAFWNVDKTFEGGVNGYNLGPANKECQTYMAQRAAENWDEYCEYLSFNTLNLPSVMNVGGCYLNANNGIKNIGDAFLVNAAYTKFAYYPDGIYEKVYLNPIDASSPLIIQLVSGTPICSNVNPSTIDNEIIIKKLIMRKIGDGFFRNMWLSCQRAGIDISKTRTGQYISSNVMPYYSQ